MSEKNITRRTFIKGMTAVAVGSATIGIMGGCQATGSSSSTSTSSKNPSEAAASPKILPAELEASLVESGEINNFVEEAEYDVVVIGAGTSGIPAALSAAEAGASVCVLQKQDKVVCQGSLATYVDLEKSDKLGPIQWVHEQMEAYDYNNDFNLLKTYAYKSNEAMSWFKKQLAAVNFTNCMESDSKDHVYEDCTCHVTGLLFPNMVLEPMTALAPLCVEKGVKFYYSTPAVQLVQDGGKVTGIIGKNKAGYVKVTAKKGVILATGDYQNNNAMVSHYLPDADYYGRKQFGKTGDGHLMGMLAGAQIERTPHCKMIHGSGASVLREEPMFAVNMNGERFLFEDVGYGCRNTILRKQPGNQMVSIFDANYMDYVYGWGSDPTTPTTANGSPEKLAALIKKGVIITADTMEELAKLAGIPADNLLASVARYNELCKLGYDYDFGKPSKYMKPVDTAPYYAQIRVFQISAIPSGLLINSNGQCLSADDNPIPGLYAAGNCSGCFYGDIDYSLNTMGLSVGRCITFGYLTGNYVANL